MKDTRPVNLDLSTVSFPITAIVSILHRVSGMVLLGGILVLMWMLDLSLSSEEDFNFLKDTMATPIAKLVIWAILAALAYHFVAGIKHLIMDLGVGETLEGGKRFAVISLIVFVVLAALAGVWLWL